MFAMHISRFERYLSVEQCTRLAAEFCECIGQAHGRFEFADSARRLISIRPVRFSFGLVLARFVIRRR